MSEGEFKGTDYKLMDEPQKVEYLERRVAQLNRAVQTLLDTLRDTASKNALVAVKLDNVVERVTEQVKP